MPPEGERLTNAEIGLLRAVVVDIPMRARYGDETSSLVVRRVIPEFARKHFVNACKRLAYNYYLRNFNIASIEILLGTATDANGDGSWSVPVPATLIC